MQAQCGRHFTVLFMVLALALGALPALAEQNQPSAAKVAVVNGSAITQEEFNAEMSRVKQRFLSMGRPLSDSQLSEANKEVLESLIASELIYQESQKQGTTVEDETINEQLKKMKERFPSEPEFKRALKKMNLSEEAMKSQLRRGMAIQQFVNERFAHKVRVSEKEAKTYYDNHSGLFKQPGQVRARHILIKVAPQADDSERAEARKRLGMIQQKLQKGEDFAALAREASEGPSSARGGDLGYFGRGQMVKSFEEEAFALKPGEVSGIVETKFGYHLIKVIDKRPETTLPFEDVKERLEQYLKQQKVQNAVKSYVEKLKEEAEVERFLKLDSS